MRDGSGTGQLVSLSAECLSERPGDQTRFTRTDGAAVDCGDREHLAGRAGDEHFIRFFQVGVVEDGLAHRNAGFLANLEEKITGYPLEETCVQRRRQSLTVADEEEVRLRTLRNLAAVFRIKASSAPLRSASCMASALLSRLFDLIRGLMARGWLRSTEDTIIAMPCFRTSGGVSVCGFTMTTSDGVAHTAGS